MVDPTAYIVLGAILLFSLVFTCVVFYRSEQLIPTYSLLRLGYELRKASQAFPASLLALAIVNTVFLLLAQADPTHHIFLATIFMDSIFFPVLVAGYRRRFLLKKRLRTLQLERQEQASKGQQETAVLPLAFAPPTSTSQEAASRCPSCGTPLMAWTPNVRGTMRKAIPMKSIFLLSMISPLAAAINCRPRCGECHRKWTRSRGG